MFLGMNTPSLSNGAIPVGSLEFLGHRHSASILWCNPPDFLGFSWAWDPDFSGLIPLAIFGRHVQGQNKAARST